MYDLNPYAAFFQDNSALLDLVNSQVLAKPLICLGDGHDGIWNLFREIGEKQERIEILDWYHLIENLYKVGGSFQRIEEVKCVSPQYIGVRSYSGIHEQAK